MLSCDVIFYCMILYVFFLYITHIYIYIYTVYYIIYIYIYSIYIYYIYSILYLYYIIYLSIIHIVYYISVYYTYIILYILRMGTARHTNIISPCKIVSSTLQPRSHELPDFGSRPRTAAIRGNRERCALVESLSCRTKTHRYTF